MPPSPGWRQATPRLLSSWWTVGGECCAGHVAGWSRVPHDRVCPFTYCKEQVWGGVCPRYFEPSDGLKTALYGKEGAAWRDGARDRAGEARARGASFEWCWALTVIHLQWMCSRLGALAATTLSSAWICYRLRVRICAVQASWEPISHRSKFLLCSVRPASNHVFEPATG